jgi:hypothetical protein
MASLAGPQVSCVQPHLHVCHRGAVTWCCISPGCGGAKALQGTGQHHQLHRLWRHTAGGQEGHRRVIYLVIINIGWSV